MAGCLYLVATPIGNLEDMTYRAVRVLQEADLIAAVRDLIRLKKTAPEFSCKSYEEIGNQMRIKSSQGGSGLVALESLGASKKHYCFDNRKKTLEIS